MNTMWLDEPPMYGCCKVKKSIPLIKNWRRTEFADFEKIYQLTRMKTYDMFGDVDPTVISEKSCLSLVQINAVNEVVANISLCNYPNVPSVPADSWLEWVSRRYRIHGITERNTLFVHMLVWDTRYNDQFYKRILDAVFISNIHTEHVIFIMPPWVTPVGFVEEHMTRIVPDGQTDSYRVQALYISLRHMHCPRLKIRRVVEEDNDDIIPILDRESGRFKELYGEFYISEMMRYPDGIRQMVVAEADGLATGVLCLNKIVDVYELERHFELGPYRGLKKANLGEKIKNQIPRVINSELIFPATEIGKKDHFKVRPVSSKTSAFRIAEEIDEDLDGSDRNYSECFCWNDGEVCSKTYSDFGSVGKNEEIILDENKEKNQTSELDVKIAIKDLEVDKRVIDEKIETEKRLSASNPETIASQQKIDDLHGEDERKSSRSTVQIRDDHYTEEEDSFAGEDEGEEFRSVDVAVEINPRKIIHKNINLPIYRGEVNAFTLELFSMREDVDERLSYDYLESVFECFPDEDYCVVLVPPFFPTFPLLQNFVRVPLRFNEDYPLVMYLAHRASVIGELKTREALISDLTVAEDLIADIPKQDQVLKDFESCFEPGSSYRGYSFLCEGTMVGFAIICVEHQIELIRNRYRVDDFISFDRVPVESHARIIHLTIMPIFANLHRYFFQELMHLDDKQALYYRLYHADASAITRAEPLVTFLGEMIPVLPRRELKCCSNNYPEDFSIRDTVDNFALYMMVPRVASSQKIDVNTRVVVVGASDCGLSLLETLVFGPNSASVSLTNITLISTDGIPFENRPDDVEKNQLPFGGRYSRDYRHLVGTRAWINVVHGTLTGIDRKDKFVTVSSMGSLYYDYLVLTCGLQYQRPKFVEELRAEKRGELHDYPNPKNCLTINTERDAANCMTYCSLVFAENPSCSVIFYGANIDCYSALGMIIRSGLPGENITLVKPAAKMCETRHMIFLGNDEVEEAVSKAVAESGVNLISDWDVVDWDLDQDETENYFVRSVTIEKKGDRRKLACDVFFNFREKTVNMHTFLAICRTGLVFDGSLVIDPEFQTNDPCIFAAGTITKYSRRFYANESSHKYHNPYEVGERLGQKLRNIIDPKNANEDPVSPPGSRLDMVLPVFKKPIITSCRLPGGYYYLDVRKSGKSRTAGNVNDLVLITGFPASSIGYFRLHLNQFDAVETITCLSKKDFEIENYVSLYGKHQTLLNDLKIRFENSTVPDLYAYFREPWAVALFLDKFECLRVENRATLLSSTVVCGDSLISDCTKALVKSKWNAMTPEDRELIEARYAGSVYQEELENCLVDFLQYSETQLPMYCNPRFLRRFLYDIEINQDDPLLRKNAADFTEQ